MLKCNLNWPDFNVSNVAFFDLLTRRLFSYHIFESVYMYLSIYFYFMFVCPLIQFQLLLRVDLNLMVFLYDPHLHHPIIRIFCILRWQFSSISLVVISALINSFIGLYYCILSPWVIFLFVCFFFFFFFLKAKFLLTLMFFHFLNYLCVIPRIFEF